MKALFIGRFQPFHLGHLFLLQQLKEHYQELIIGIGSSQYHDTYDNPFSEQERCQMITQSLEEADIKDYRIVSIPDIHDPPHWVDHVCSIVSDFDVVITNNPITKKLFSQKGYTVEGTRYFNRKEYSGKEIRRRITTDTPWEHLVPSAVSAYIHRIGGIQRLKGLSN
jgi:nicotinamide-nucleotide adenylyltransferase